MENVYQEECRGELRDKSPLAVRLQYSAAVCDITQPSANGVVALQCIHTQTQLIPSHSDMFSHVQLLFIDFLRQ